MKRVLHIGESAPQLPSDEWELRTAEPGAAPEEAATTDVVVLDAVRAGTADLVRAVAAASPGVPIAVLRAPDQPYDRAIARQVAVYSARSEDPLRAEWIVRRATGCDRFPRRPAELSAGQLPMLPQSAVELLDALDNPELGVREAAALVEQDPAVTAQVMSLANSAFYGLPRRVGRLAEATAIIGLATLRRMVLAGAMFRAFDGVADRDFVERIRDVSVLRMRIAGLLAETPNEELATAALLMDVGRLAHLTMEAEPERSLFPTADQLDAEAARCGLDSGLLAGFLLQEWGVPATIASAVAGAWWDDPVPVGSGPWEHLLRLASALAAGGMGEDPPISDDWVATIGLAARYAGWREDVADIAMQWPAA